MNFFNAITNILNQLQLQLLSFFSTLWMRCTLSFKGITIGDGVTFVGCAKFIRASSASVSIGNACNFRSHSTSNLIGINRPCIVSALAKNSSVVIGNSCGFSGTVIGCFSTIALGNNVRCGANTLITDSDWHLDDPRSSKPRPIVIEDNVWLGVNVTVLKGVRIGANSVIGAGSVVVKDIPANVIAAGNPCRVIRLIAS